MLTFFKLFFWSKGGEGEGSGGGGGWGEGWSGEGWVEEPKYQLYKGQLIVIMEGVAQAYCS